MQVSGIYDHFNVSCGDDGNWVDPGTDWKSCVYKCKVPVAETGYNAQNSSLIVSRSQNYKGYKYMYLYRVFLSIC